MTSATRHRNWHVIVEIYNNVIFVVKFLIAEKAFKEILSSDLGDHGKTLYIDLFLKETAMLAKSILL